MLLCSNIYVLSVAAHHMLIGVPAHPSCCGNNVIWVFRYHGHILGLGFFLSVIHMTDMIKGFVASHVHIILHHLNTYITLSNHPLRNIRTICSVLTLTHIHVLLEFTPSGGKLN